jgi:hypothetical protein
MSFSKLLAQEISVYKNRLIENKCFNYNNDFQNLYSEVQNITFTKSGINIKNENAFIVSTPISIKSNQNTPFLGLSYVIKSNGFSPEDIKFYYSTSTDGISYDSWKLLGIELNNDTVIFSELGFLNKSTNYLQYKIVFSGKSSELILKSIRISIINPGFSMPDTEIINDNREKVLKTNLFNVISRTDWGCADGENAPLWMPQYTTVTHIVIHHTAGSNNITQDYKATVRSIWSQHTYTNGWGDIGYNYLIDSYGQTYEGRAGGNNAIGAHCGFNTGTMGVSIMGTYTTILPSDTAIKTLESILAWKCDDSKLNPLGNAMHTSSGKYLNIICGHRDVKSTDCPGDYFYATLPDIRADVNNLLNTSVLQKNDISCYPNPFTEILKLDIKHSNWSNFTIEISDIYGRIVYNLPIFGFVNGIKEINLNNLSNGIYFLRILTPTDILFNKKIIKA